MPDWEEVQRELSKRGVTLTLLWKEYREAYEDVLSKCSTKWAPWYIVPADHKWYRNLAVAEIIEDALDDMDPKFPKPTFDPALVKIDS